MVDPITITGLVAAILSVILGGSGPILPRLWSSLKRLYGRACQTTSEFPSKIHKTSKNKSPPKLSLLQAT